MTQIDEQALDAQITTWLGAQADRVIETSCARVFLIGDSAFKTKRPVDFGFLDYSILERRQWALERELAFNRAAASDIYRRVAPITRTDDGGFVFDGDGETVGYALQMRRFDENAVLSAQPWAVDARVEEALGRTIARFHAAAPVRHDGGGTRALGYTIQSNAKMILGLGDRLDIGDARRLVGLTDAVLDKAAPILNARPARGFARQCHGDLHLGNILLEDGQPILFDCIEFNDLLSNIDVLYDLAFLLMDLDFRRRRDAANRVMNAYLDEAARTFDDGLFADLSVLPLMLSVRAAVRCHVEAHGGNDEAARAYLAAALAHLEPAPHALVAVGGLSGSGKSTFARAAAPGLGGAPGAVVLRTDEIRKRLWGAGPLEKLPADAYAPEFGAKVYERLLAEAKMVLAAGRSVVLDAVFLKPHERAAAQALAAQAGVPFQGAWLHAAPEVLRQRVGARTNDASDADVAVLEAQLTRDAGAMDWRVIASDPGFEGEARALADMLG